MLQLVIPLACWLAGLLACCCCCRNWAWVLVFVENFLIDSRTFLQKFLPSSRPVCRDFNKENRNSTLSQRSGLFLQQLSIFTWAPGGRPSFEGIIVVKLSQLWSGGEGLRKFGSCFVTGKLDPNFGLANKKKNKKFKTFFISLQHVAY
jgi:hypothetical protein